MKFTMSHDGKLRANLRATMRVTREELDDIRATAKASSCKTLSDFLNWCLLAGYWLESNDENKHLEEAVEQ